MAKRHKYAGASVSITTRLDASGIAHAAEAAAKQAETIQAMIRLEESRPGRLVYSIRNRVTGGRIEFMTFEVTSSDRGDARQVRTRILSYKVKRQWILVIPLPWQMIAWGNYKKFMYNLAEAVRSSDASANADVVELAGAA